MTVVGLTGTTGAGKGEVGRVFASLGAYVADTDQIYHRLLQENDALKRELCEAFGDILEQGEISRRKLAGIVFADAEKLEQLNAITHRYVLQETKRLLAQAQRAGVEIGVIDAPLLYESGADRQCQVVIGVVAPAEVRMKRIMQRDGISKEAAQRRMENQKSDAWFRERCGKILENDSTTEDLHHKAEELFYDILREQRRERHE